MNCALFRYYISSEVLTVGRFAQAGLLQAQAEGELSSGINVRNLARFYSAVIKGMSVQARDGAIRKEVASIAEMAMYNWPGSNA